MTDIVKRLEQVEGDAEDAREAAAEIRLLREELADVRADAALLRAEIARLKSGQQ
jgi:hypothetical protein